MAFGQNSRGGSGGRGRGGFRGGRGGSGDRGGRGRGGFGDRGGRGRGGFGDRGGRGRGGFGDRGGRGRGGFGDRDRDGGGRGGFGSRGGSPGFGGRGGSRDGGRGRGGSRGGGGGGGGRPFEAKREFLSDSIYVGQLPSEMQESDLQKLFPKAKSVQVTPAAGPRPGHAFITFNDDTSAAAAVKQGATFNNTHLKVAFQNKRGEPQKRSVDADNKSGPQAKKLKKAAGSDDDDEEDDDDDEESMDFDEDDEDDEEEEGESDEDDEVDEKKIKKTVAKLVAGGKPGKGAAAKNVEEDDDEDDEDDEDDDDESDDDDDDDEEEEVKPTKSQKTPPSSAKQTTPAVAQNKNKGKPELTKPTVIDNSLQKKNKPTAQPVSAKPTSAEVQKRSVDTADKSGPQAKKLKSGTPTVGKNGVKGKGKQEEEEDEDDDDDSDDEELDFGEDDDEDDDDEDDEDDDDEDDDDDDEEEVTPKKTVGKSPATGKQTKLAAKAPVAEDDDDDESDDDDDDDDDEEEAPKPTKATAKTTSVSKQGKPAAKPSAAKDDEDDDDDDEDEESSPPAPLKSALKKPAVTPVKAQPKSAQNNKQEATPKQTTPAADKPLNKLQLFINSIKESVSVSEMKTLYPKAKLVKLQKRKVGPNNKFIQFAFVTFENESDAADALKAHSQIGGEKVNISYAFASTGKQPPQQQAKNTNNEPNKKQEQKPANTNKKQENKQNKPAPANENAKKKQEKHKSEKQLSTNSIYVGQLPEHVAEDDVKKLFPKANKIELFAAKAKNKGVRPGFAFVSFPDDNSAAAAIKLGPSLTLKDTQLKVAYQTKRATPATAE